MPPLFSGLGVLEIFLGGIARPGDDGEIDDLLLACVSFWSGEPQCQSFSWALGTVFVAVMAVGAVVA